jgi:hypothetical protein
VWLHNTSLEGPNTPLVPLRRPKTKKSWLASKLTSTPDHEFWTANTARDWTQFGYTYEACPGPSKDPDTKRARKLAAIERVKTLYGWIYPDTNGGRPKQYLALHSPNPAQASPSGMFDGTGTTMNSPLPPANRKRWESWNPPDFVAGNINGLSAIQPLIAFGIDHHPWYPRLINPAVPMSDATVMADLEVDVPPPPPVVHATAHAGFRRTIFTGVKNTRFGPSSPPATEAETILTPKASSPAPVVAEEFVDTIPSHMKAETELKDLPDERVVQGASEPTNAKVPEVVVTAPTSAAVEAVNGPIVAETSQPPTNLNK